MGGCTPKMQACEVTCGHYQFVTGYRQEVERHTIAAENASLGYAAELADYVRDHPVPTFKQWLIQSKREEPMVNKQYQPGDVMPKEWHAIADSDAQRALRTSTAPAAAQRSLLSVALASDHGVSKLASLTSADFADHPLHQHVYEAITHQVGAEARDGVLNQQEAAVLGREYQPPAHDAPAVTDLLRERGQLPMEYDPLAPMRTVDPERFGLGAWQTYAEVPMMAGALADDVRTHHQHRYLLDVSTRATSLAQGSIELGQGSQVLSRAGDVQLAIAHDLVAMPRALRDGLPLADQQGKAMAQEYPSAAVDTTALIRRGQMAQKPQSLRLPKRPALSPYGHRVVSRRTA
jgi:hypothetical protein